MLIVLQPPAHAKEYQLAAWRRKVRNPHIYQSFKDGVPTEDLMQAYGLTRVSFAQIVKFQETCNGQVEIDIKTRNDSITISHLEGLLLRAIGAKYKLSAMRVHQTLRKMKSNGSSNSQ